MSELKLKRFDSPEAVFAAYWSGGEEVVSVDDVLDGECGGFTEDGEEVTFTGREGVEGIRAQGFWGYADKPNGIVNVWVGPDAKLDDVMFFLGHEIGHLTGEQLGDELAEEMRAHGYGEVAKQAHEWLVILKAEGMNELR